MSPTDTVRALYAAADKHPGLRDALTKATLTAFKLGLGTGFLVGIILVGLIWAVVA